MIRAHEKAWLSRAAVAIALLLLGPLFAAAEDKSAAPQAPDEPAAVAAPHDDKGPQSKQYADVIRPFLTRHCLECHGTEKPKGDRRPDRRSSEFAGKSSGETWEAVRERIARGEMPPKGKPRPPEDDIRIVSDWIGRKVRAAEADQRISEGRVILRRLNRVEYENTVRDLLGIYIELQAVLPRDSSSNGFDNVGEALHLSSFQMEKYLEAAERSLNLAITNRPKPPPLVKQRYFLKNQHVFKLSTESVYRPLDDDALVLFSSSPWNSVSLSEFYPRNGGNYRFRVSASGFQSAEKPVTYRLDAGNLSMTGKPGLVGYFDAPPDKPGVVEFATHLEPTNSLRIHPYALAGAQTVHKIGADKYDGPGLAVQWVEVEGPVNDVWPPESHRRIFGDLEQAKDRADNYGKRVHVGRKAPRADAKRILRNFARRAFRRAVSDDDMQPFLSLVDARLNANYSFEQAVRVGLQAMLVSPEFLFLDEKPGRLDDYALASRLSYFLWSTMPDEELL